MSLTPSKHQLVDTVVSNNYCVGCGVCAAVDNSSFRMALDEFGQYVATFDSHCSEPEWEHDFTSICPFSGVSPDENELGRSLFGGESAFDQRIGYHLACYAGFVEEGSFRLDGSSGGMTTWLCVELLRRNMIDGVVHMKVNQASKDTGVLFKMGISRTEDEIRGGSKSRYYPGEYSEVLKLVRETPGRYAFVGLPCLIKSVRLLALKDQLIRDRVAYCFGLVCGHMKSASLAQYIAWKMNVAPENLRYINFRHKRLDLPANWYGVEVISSDAPDKPVYGENSVSANVWTQCLFMYNACNYCDDLFAETADAAFGDAWLSNYKKDGRGTNVIVVRNREIANILEDSQSQSKIHLEALDVESTARSQASGLRKRRDDLAYRLYLKDIAGEWRPSKRIAASSNHLSRFEKRICELRIKLAEQSHTAFKNALAAKNYKLFNEQMNPLVRRLKPTLWERVPLTVKRGIAFVFGKR